MELNPFAPEFKDLPETLPIFPLGGVLLLPCGQLPLNIFEPRYLAMVDAALSGERMIGMVQPREGDVRDGEDSTPVYETGCAGKITDFNETTDGRYLITLTGISRFRIAEEIAMNDGYRRVKADWSSFKDDVKSAKCLDIDREKLKTLLHKYFHKEGMDCDWSKVDDAPDGKLITCLSMVCPFDPCEKQALLEAECGRTRASLFMTMLEMAVCGSKDCASKH